MDTQAKAAEKSKRFAVRIVRLCQYLRSDKKEHTLSNQLLRSGTSIGANIAEAECAISRNDFISKNYIAFKESNETLYWLDLLHETGYLTQREYGSIKADCVELRKMLSAITKTAREKKE